MQGWKYSAVKRRGSAVDCHSFISNREGLNSYVHCIKRGMYLQFHTHAMEDVPKGKKCSTPIFLESSCVL